MNPTTYRLLIGFLFALVILVLWSRARAAHTNMKEQAVVWCDHTEQMAGQPVTLIYRCKE